jgi:hypothetical protein
MAAITASRTTRRTLQRRPSPSITRRPRGKRSWEGFEQARERLCEAARAYALADERVANACTTHGVSPITVTIQARNGVAFPDFEYVQCGVLSKTSSNSHCTV